MVDSNLTPRQAISIGVGVLVVISVFAVLSPVGEPSKAKQIEQNMHNLDTASIAVASSFNLTIKNSDGSQLTNYNQRKFRTQYDFANNSYVASGVQRGYFAGKQKRAAFERYYIDGTVYTRQSTELKSSPTKEDWVVIQANNTGNLSSEITLFSQKEWFDNETANKTLSNNSTLVYQYDMLGEHSYLYKELERNNLTRMDKYRDVLDVYAIVIKVNATTLRLERVQIIAYGNLTKKELTRFQDVYKNVSQNRFKSAGVAYGQEINFMSYNDNVNITLPESAKKAEDETNN